MAVQVTRKYTNTADIYYDLAKQSPLFREEDYNSWGETGEHIDYLETIAGTKDKTSDSFNIKDYDLLDKEDRLGYLMNEYYGDKNSEEYRKNKEYFDQTIQYKKDEILYASLSDFEKVINSIGGILGNAANELFLGTIEGLIDLGGTIVGAKDFVAQDITGVSANREALQNYARKYTYLDKSGFWKVTNDVVTGITQMAPLALNVVAPGVGTGIYFGSMAGRTAEEAIQANPDIDYLSLIGYTAAVTGVEFATEKLSSILFGGSAIDNLMGWSTTSKAGNWFTRVGLDFLSEGLEESVSEFADSVLYTAMIDPNAPLASIEEILYAGLIGGIIGGVSTTGRIMSTKKQTILEDGSVILTKDARELGLKGKELSKSQTLTFNERLQNAIQTLKSDPIVDLQIKYSGEDLKSIKQNHREEFNEALALKEKNNKQLTNATVALSKVLEWAGVDGFNKAVDIANYTIQEQERLLKAYTTKLTGTTAKNRQVEQLFKQKNPGSSLVIADEISSKQQAVKDAIKNKFGIDVYFGTIGEQDGLIKKHGVTLDSKTIVLDAKETTTMSVNDIMNKVVSEELAHTLQYQSGILTADTLYEVQQALGLDSDEIKANVAKLDSSYNKKDLLTKLSEAQAKTIAQMMLFDDVAIQKIFDRKQNIFKRIYTWLKGMTLKLTKNKTELNTLKYNTILKTMKKYRNTVANSIKSEEELKKFMAVSDEELKEMLDIYLAKEKTTKKELEDIRKTVIEMSFNETNALIKFIQKNNAKAEGFDEEFLNNLVSDKYVAADLKNLIGIFERDKNGMIIKTGVGDLKATDLVIKFLLKGKENNNIKSIQDADNYFDFLPNAYALYKLKKPDTQITTLNDLLEALGKNDFIHLEDTKAGRKILDKFKNINEKIDNLQIMPNLIWYIIKNDLDYSKRSFVKLYNYIDAEANSQNVKSIQQMSEENVDAQNYLESIYNPSQSVEDEYLSENSEEEMNIELNIPKEEFKKQIINELNSLKGKTEEQKISETSNQMSKTDVQNALDNNDTVYVLQEDGSTKELKLSKENMTIRGDNLYSVKMKDGYKNLEGICPIENIYSSKELVSTKNLTTEYSSEIAFRRKIESLKNDIIKTYGKDFYDEILKLLPSRRFDYEKRVEDRLAKLDNKEQYVKDYSKFTPEQFENYISELNTVIKEQKTGKSKVEETKPEPIVEEVVKNEIQQEKPVEIKNKKSIKDISSSVKKGKVAEGQISMFDQSAKKEPKVVEKSRPKNKTKIIISDGQYKGLKDVTTKHSENKILSGESREYTAISHEIIENNQQYFGKINNETWKEMRNEIEKSGDKYKDQMLILFDYYCMTEGNFNVENQKEFDDLMAAKTTVAAQTLAMQSKAVEDSKIASAMANDWREHGFKFEISDEFVGKHFDISENRINELTEKINSLKNELNSLESQIAIKQKMVSDEEAMAKLKSEQTDASVNATLGVSDLTISAKHEEIRRLNEEKRILMTGTNEQKLDYAIEHSSTAEGGKIIGDLLTEIKKSAEYSDEKSSTKKEQQGVDAFPKFKEWSKKWFPMIKSFRIKMMLSSPVTWVRNTISNNIMRGLDKMLTGFERTIFGEKEYLQGQTALRSSKGSKELSEHIKKNCGDVILRNVIRKETSRYDTDERRQAWLVEQDEIRAKQSNNWFVRNLAKLNIIEQKALNRGFKTKDGLPACFFGDETIMLNSICDMTGNIIASNVDYICDTVFAQALQTEKDSVQKSKIARAQQSRDVTQIFDIMNNSTNTVIKTEFQRFLDLAGTEASKLYFRNDNVFNKLINKIGEISPAAGFVASIIMPFPKVAANVLGMAYRLSPLNFINYFASKQKIKRMMNDPELLKSATGTEQAKMYRQFSEATFGTFSMVVGCVLAALGFIDVDDDDYMGPSLNLGFARIGLSNLAPALTTFSMGAAIIDAGKKDKDGFKQALDVLYNNTLLGNLDNIFMNASAEDWLGTVSINYVSQYIPAALKLFTKFTDMRAKDKSGSYFERLGKTLASYIPGLSYAVPSKINPYTGDNYYTKGSDYWFKNILLGVLPIEISLANKGNLELEAENLKTETTGLSGSFTINDEDIKLSGRDKEKYAKFKAKWVNEQFNNIKNGSQVVTVQSDDGTYITTTYDKLTNSQKSRVLKQLYNKSTELAKIKYWIDLGNTYIVTDYDDYEEYIKLFGSKNIEYKTSYGTTKFVKKG